MRPLALLALLTLGATLPAPHAIDLAPPAPPAAEPAGAPAWAPIQNIGDDFYWQVGKFAVLVHGLAYNRQLALQRVVSGSVQPAGKGKNYLLVLDVAEAGRGVGKWQALVWGVPKSREETWKVVSFAPVAN